MWIVTSVSGVILLFLLLLAVPIDIYIRITGETTFHLVVRVGWLFGLITKDIERTKGPKKRKPEAKEKKQKAKKKSKKSKKNIRLMLALARTRGLIPKIIQFIRNLLRQIHIRDLKVELCLGLGDPGKTGMLFGLMSPLLLYSRTLLPLDIQIRPDFLNASLRGNCQATIRLIPIRFMAAFIILLASPVALRIIKTLLVTRGK